MKIDKCEKCGAKGNVNVALVGKSSALLCVKCQCGWYDHRDTMVSEDFKKWMKDGSL